MSPEDLERIPFPVWVATAAFDVFLANAAWHTLTGSRANDANIWSGFQPDSATAVRDTCHRSAALAKPFRMEATLASREGSRDLRIEVAPMRHARRRVEGWMGLAHDITADHQVLEHTKLHHQNLQQLVDSVDGIFWINSADNRLTYLLSSGYERLFGHCPSHFTQSPKNWFESWILEGHLEIKEAMREMAAGRRDHACLEFRVRTTTVPRWLEARYSLIRDTNGQPWRIVGFATDITRHRELELALRASEERIREVTKVSDDIFFSVSADLIQSMEGESPEPWIAGAELLGTYERPLAWLEQVLEKDRPAIQTFIRHLAAGKLDRSQIECRLRRKSDGSIRTVLFRAYLSRDSKRRPSKICGVITDITDRKIIEDALRVSEERFKLAAEGSTDGLYDWHIPQNHVYYSPRWKEMLGHAEQEVGNHFDEWRNRLHPNDHDRAMSYVNDFLAGRTKKYELEARLRHRDGTYRWILSRATLIRDARGLPQRLVGSHVDLTELRELQRKLLEVSEQERRIIGYDLHDGLGQQLTAVEMLALLAYKRVPETDPDARKLLSEMASLIRTSISHVRTLSRGLAPTTPTGKGLVDALEELVHLSQAASGIRCQLHPGGVLTPLDPLVSSQLYRIAQEAVNNALKHSQATRIDVYIRQSGGTSLLIIDDDGQGITAGNGQRAKHGLEIMKYRAHLLGAHLEITPRLDGGTSVRCQLISYL